MHTDILQVILESLVYLGAMVKVAANTEKQLVVW